MNLAIIKIKGILLAAVMCAGLLVFAACADTQSQGDEFDQPGSEGSFEPFDNGQNPPLDETQPSGDSLDPFGDSQPPVAEDTVAPESSPDTSGDELTPSAEETTLPDEDASTSAEVTLQFYSDPELGEILTDSNGMTLYMLESDPVNQSICSDSCADQWPPLILDGGETTAGDGIDASLIGEFVRDDGQTQVTYNGLPLYYYSFDQNPGDVTGHELQDTFGMWRAVSPDGQGIA
jgi:predicted lipoprotein with Yx(FWY)xxD motif